MLLFRSEEDVTAWCAAHRREPGAIVAVDVLARLARSWYGDRLDPDWRPRSRDASQALLEAQGLSGPFWQLPAAG